MPIDDGCCHNSPSAADEGHKLVSIKGSNKTVESPSVVLGKRKKTEDEAHEIPLGLDLLMQTAYTIRRSMLRTKLRRESVSVSEDRKDLESELDSYRAQLDECEDTIRSLVKLFKELEQLPHDWEYDADTASTFVSAEADISTLPKMPPSKEKRDVKGKNYTQLTKDLEYKNDSESESVTNHDPATASTFVAAEEDVSALPKMPPFKEKRFCCSRVIDPNQKFPKTTDVPLDEEEKKTWTDFKEFDKDKLGLSFVVNFDTVHKHDIPLALDNPIVSLTSKFAVTAFNEAIEMCIKKGEQENIHDFDVVKCDYLKMNRNSYYFYITIEAFEERKRGVYDAKVKLNWDNGSKSLIHFVLTDRKPRVLKETTKLRTHPDSWQDSSRIQHSGMIRRRNRRGICRGYDFRTPWGHGGP